MDMTRLMGAVRAFVLFVSAAVISPSGFASTCPSPDPTVYNGYCIDGIRPGGYPYFDTGVSFEWQSTDSSLSATKDNGVVPLFHVSPTESYVITNLSVDFSAVLDFNDLNNKTYGDEATGSIEIFGHIVGLSIDENPAPLLMSADLEGVWVQDATDKSLIGFNTMNIVCHADIDTYLGGDGCTTNESLYFDLDDPIDFAYLGKNGKGKVKTKTDGVAIATVPVPPAVWLFGSGLLGLVGIARRKKAA